MGWLVCVSVWTCANESTQEKEWGKLIFIKPPVFLLPLKGTYRRTGMNVGGVERQKATVRDSCMRVRVAEPSMCTTALSDCRCISPGRCAVQSGRRAILCNFSIKAKRKTERSVGSQCVSLFEAHGNNTAHVPVLDFTFWFWFFFWGGGHWKPCAWQKINKSKIQQLVYRKHCSPLSTVFELIKTMKLVIVFVSCREHKERKLAHVSMPTSLDSVSC